MDKKNKNQKNKEYSGGGVILLLQTKNKEKYIILVKRSDNAPVNPGTHSGFFGGVDDNNINEKSNPELIGARELIEEVCFTSKNHQKIYPLRIKTKSKISKEVLEYPKKHFIRLWNYEKKLNLGTDIKFIESQNNNKGIDYIENDGHKKIIVAQFNLNFNLNERIILDGETVCEDPPACLLDREVNVFNLKEFKNWWLYGKNGDIIRTKYSFQTGKKIKKGHIKRDEDKLSPSLVLALNKWWELTPSSYKIS